MRLAVVSPTEPICAATSESLRLGLFDHQGVGRPRGGHFPQRDATPMLLRLSWLKMSFRSVHPLVFIMETVGHEQISKVLKNKQPDRRRQIVLVARAVDLGDQFRQRHLLQMRNFFQVRPELIFKADAGLVSVNDDRTFDDRGFHEGPPKHPPPTYDSLKQIRNPAEVGHYPSTIIRGFVTPNTATSFPMCDFPHITKGGCHGQPQPRCRCAHRALEHGSRAMAAL